ncbi:MAG: NAD-dependent epimerase/dehydratase family protein [Cocleimonas sp.]
MKKIWIIGCGDIGRRLVRLYLSIETKPNISGLISSQKSFEACTKLGIDSFKFNLDNQDCFKQLNRNDFKDCHLFYFAPPPSEGKQDLRLSTFLEKMGDAPKRIVLISTTGVYGDSKGEWIDETTPVNPVADRAHRRLSAENSLKQWAKNSHREYMILRVPGIYAQDRLPLERLQKQLPIVNEADAGFTNRIHADDLAHACLLAMESSHSNEIINITDGQPSTMTDYFNQVADFANLPRPPQISMQEAEKTLSAGMVSYLKESRRIKNKKMLALLMISLKFPNLKSALS